MIHQLTQEEKDKILDLVFSNPSKSCTIAQCFLDSLQVVSLSEYAKLHNKSKRTIQYRSEKLEGVTIGSRRFVSFIQ